MFVTLLLLSDAVPENQNFFDKKIAKCVYIKSSYREITELLKLKFREVFMQIFMGLPLFAQGGSVGIFVVFQEFCTFCTAFCTTPPVQTVSQALHMPLT